MLTQGFNMVDGLCNPWAACQWTQWLQESIKYKNHGTSKLHYYFETSNH